MTLQLMYLLTIFLQIPYEIYLSIDWYLFIIVRIKVKIMKYNSVGSSQVYSQTPCTNIT